jgi:hypothetical protein
LRQQRGEAAVEVSLGAEGAATLLRRNIALDRWLLEAVRGSLSRSIAVDAHFWYLVVELCGVVKT